MNIVLDSTALLIPPVNKRSQYSAAVCKIPSVLYISGYFHITDVNRALFRQILKCMLKSKHMLIS